MMNLNREEAIEMIEELTQFVEDLDNKSTEHFKWSISNTLVDKDEAMLFCGYDADMSEDITREIEDSGEYVIGQVGSKYIDRIYLNDEGYLILEGD